VKHMQPLDVLAQGAKPAPIESSPFAKLQVNQNGQNKEHDDAGQNALFIHEGEDLRRSPRDRQRGNGSPKVNEQATGVKLVKCLCQECQAVL